MLNFLRTDLLQCSQTAQRLRRKYTPELAILSLQIIIHICLSFFLSLAPHLLYSSFNLRPVKLSIWILGTIIFFVSSIFLEYDRLTYHVLACLLANGLSFVSLAHLDSARVRSHILRSTLPTLDWVVLGTCEVTRRDESRVAL